VLLPATPRIASHLPSVTMMHVTAVLAGIQTFSQLPHY
jgi:hypothetical protein